MTQFSTRLIRIVVPAMLATTIVMAQSQQQGQPAQNRTQTPTFRARTDYISTDVTVKDRKGMFVPGLTEKDFQVFEDGVLQNIVMFTQFIGGRALPTFVGTAPVPQMDGIILPAPAARPDTTGRIFIIFIDDMHLQASDSPLVKQSLRLIRDEILKENDLIGIVSTGFSSIEQDLVYDPSHKRFDQAVEKVMGSAETPREIIDLPMTTGGIQKLRYNANVAFKTAYGILEAAAKRTDRRKAFLYVSSGYHFNPYKDSRYEKAKELLGIPSSRANENPDQNSNGSDIDSRRLPGENPFDKPGSEFSEMDLISEIAYLTAEARRANVVFYTIDPRGLLAGPNLADRLTHEEWRDFVVTTVSSLHILADNTGGFCICERNDIRPDLRKIDNEMSDYYVIGYNTNNPDPMKLRRRIEIKANKPDLTLVYRTEYTLPKTQKVPAPKK
jgi:VWFA-related protein